MQSPSVPSPTAVASAQTASNKETATTQSELNAINQQTPTGSLTYSQNGTWADGTPKLTATTSLSDAQQGILNSQQQINQNIGNVGVTESAKLGGLLDSPFNVDTATENQLDSLASARLDPQIARDQASLQQQLANQGIKPGSQAYNNAVTLQSQNSNDARNQLYLNGFQTAQNAALLQRQEPINEILALGGQTQVSTPGFTNTPTTGVQGTDVAGITQQGYSNANAQTSATNQALGSAASTLGGWLFSDERLKTDIHSTGAKTKDGIPLKTFRMKGSPMLNMGVMAQDAQKKRPDAVKTTPSGYKAVNYDKIGSPMLRLGAR